MPIPTREVLLMLVHFEWSEDDGADWMEGNGKENYNSRDENERSLWQ